MSRIASFVHTHLSEEPASKFKDEKNQGGEKRMRWLVIGSVALALTAWVVWAQQGQKEQPPDTGLKVGDFVPAYNPIHVAGPDKGTNTCPV